MIIFDEEKRKAFMTEKRTEYINTVVQSLKSKKIEDIEKEIYDRSSYACSVLNGSDEGDYYHRELAGKSFSEQINLASLERKNKCEKKFITYARADAGFDDRTHLRIRNGCTIDKKTAIQAVIPFEFITPDEKIKMIENAGFCLSETNKAECIIREQIYKGITHVPTLDYIICLRTGDLYFNVMFE